MKGRGACGFLDEPPLRGAALVLRAMWTPDGQRAWGGSGRRALRSGQTMTIAVWKGEWLVFNTDDLLDIDGSVANLRRAEQIVQAVAAHHARRGCDV